MNMLCAYGKWPLFHVFALTFILRVNAAFIERPVATTVIMGDSTYLKCSISSSASAEVSWYHSPVAEGTSNTRSVYSRGKILNPYTGRFKIVKGALKGTFDLVIQRAKLRDAGIYVCQIAGTTKRAIAQLTVLANSTFTERPVATTVIMGDSTYLKCSISSSEPAEVSWYHSPVAEGTSKTRSVYSSGKIFYPYKERFKIEKEALNGTFDLVIKTAKLRDAGIYVCQIAGTTKRAIAQLTVLESGPLWMTKNRPSGFIERNSCGLKSDTIHLSCGIRYRGNVTPKLQMALVQNDQRIAVKESNFWCVSSDVSVNCYYLTEAEKAMDGSFFICSTNTAENIQRETEAYMIKILYAGYTWICPMDRDTKYKFWSYVDWSYMYIVKPCVMLAIMISIYYCGMQRSHGDRPPRPNNDNIRERREVNDRLDVQPQPDINPLNIRLTPMTGDRLGVQPDIDPLNIRLTPNTGDRLGVQPLNIRLTPMTGDRLGVQSDINPLNIRLPPMTGYRRREDQEYEGRTGRRAHAPSSAYLDEGIRLLNHVLEEHQSLEPSSAYFDIFVRHREGGQPDERYIVPLNIYRSPTTANHIEETEMSSEKCSTSQYLEIIAYFKDYPDEDAPLLLTLAREIEGLTKENTRLWEALTCKYCLVKEANTVFLNCGHLTCCSTCSRKVNRCPNCRAFIIRLPFHYRDQEDHQPLEAHNHLPTTPLRPATAVNQVEESEMSSEKSSTSQDLGRIASFEDYPDEDNPLVLTLASEKQEVMEKNSRLRKILNCEVCMDKEADTVFLPCGHLIRCSTCSDNVGAKCPHCGAVIKGKIKAYFS